MELVTGVSLLSYIKSKPNKKVNENECKVIFKQIMIAINYLHDHNIYHRDIKLENILIDINKTKIKIIDFGFSCLAPKNKLLNFFCGTPSYMSPEIINKINYCGYTPDLWSIGVLFYILLYGVFPFKGTIFY